MIKLKSWIPLTKQSPIDSMLKEASSSDEEAEHHKPVKGSSRDVQELDQKHSAGSRSKSSGSVKKKSKTPSPDRDESGPEAGRAVDGETSSGLESSKGLSGGVS